jgi:hypothetical protein
MRFHCRISRGSLRAATAFLASSLLLLAGPARAQDDSVDPSLLDMEGLELLRALEAQDAADEAPEAEPATASAADAASAAREAARQDEQERNEARLKALLDQQEQIQSELAEHSRASQDPGPGPTRLGDASPRAAPGPPHERELPAAIFDREEVSIPAGTWGNPRRLKLVKLTLDADGDGVPELTRFLDPKGGQQVRREEDRNYDGVIDSWSDYAWGESWSELVARVLDSNDDGNPDVWELYEDGRMTSREVDRDDDGVRDAFYRYDGDSLAEERHDSNNDGTIDLVILYDDRLRVSAEEDQDLDGRMDTWTRYIAVDGAEVVTRIERDTRGEGAVTVVELFDTASGRAIISRKDEDVNGDGEVDVVSIYESGRLVRREISDPALMEL